MEGNDPKNDSDNSLENSSNSENDEENTGFFLKNQQNNQSFNEGKENPKSKNLNTMNMNYNNYNNDNNYNHPTGTNFSHKYDMDSIMIRETNPDTDMINPENYYKRFIRDPGIEGRKASRLLFLRSFNNWVKAALINKACYVLGKELSILDLCCGRGGDLEKYFRNDTRIYVGADLSDESLRNAMDRIIKLKAEKMKSLKTKCFFITEDISDPENNLMKKIPVQLQFDLVSCQFAMHYHFENETRVRAFLKNVTERLNDGGYFIGTIIDANVLVKRLRNRKYKNNNYLTEKFTFGNEFYSVKFYQKRFPKEQGPYGIKYGFYLEDSIDKRDEFGKIKYVGEYLVLFENFIRICKDYDLHLVTKKNFTEFYEENMEIQYYRNLFRKMIKEIEVSSKEMQWEIIQLYQVFMFRKGKDKGKRYTPVVKHSKITYNDMNPEFIEDTFE
jgi:mRNA (guanine-N7-)-methyltransferase